MGAGRPTAYKPEYCAKLVEHMAKGLSFETFAAQVGVCRETLYDWTHRHAEFLHAKNRGQVLREQLWQILLLKSVTGKLPKNASAAALIFGLKNVCGWSDKKETTHSGTVAIQAVPAMTKEQAKKMLEDKIKAKQLSDGSGEDSE